MSLLSKEGLFSSLNVLRQYTDSFEICLKSSASITREFHFGTNTCLQLDHVNLYLSINNPTDKVIKLSKDYIQEIINRISVKLRVFKEKDHADIIEESIDYAGTFFLINSFIRRRKDDIEDHEDDYKNIDEIPVGGIDIRIPMKYMLAKFSQPNIVHCESIVFRIDFYSQSQILVNELSESIKVNGIFVSNSYQMDMQAIELSKKDKTLILNKKLHTLPETIYSTLMEQVLSNKTTLAININLSSPYACNLYYVFYNDKTGSFNPDPDVYTTNHEITANGKTYPFSNNKGFLTNKNHIIQQHYHDFLNNTNGSYITKNKWVNNFRIYSAAIYGLIQTQGLILKITLNKGFISSDIKILVITQVKDV